MLDSVESTEARADSAAGSDTGGQQCSSGMTINAVFACSR